MKVQCDYRTYGLFYLVLLVVAVIGLLSAGCANETLNARVVIYQITIIGTQHYYTLTHRFHDSSQTL